jgi:hypothetical protein
VSPPIAEYLAERVRPIVFLPALAGLWLAAMWAAGGNPGAGRSALSLAVLACALLQFRLWDDLEALAHDRQVHPDRVLARAASGPFRWLLGALTAAALAIAAVAGPAALVTLGALDLTFLAAYRLVRPRVADGVWRYPLLLSKYPAFALITAEAAGAVSDPARISAVMAAAFAGACVYEALHDRRRPAGARS